MKTLSFLLLGLFLTFNLFAAIHAVYDQDDRIEYLKHSNNEYKKIAASTAAMFDKETLLTTDTGFKYLFDKTKVGEVYYLCPGERFFDYPAAARCSGTLVGKDLILTAAHCVKDDSWCKDNSWVFDYYFKGDHEKTLNFKKSQVYNCIQIIERQYTSDGRIDFALLKLDREVTDREPVKYRANGDISLGDELFVAGYPMGIPLIITDNGVVLKNDSEFDFQANLDTFTGNSGSGVFNAQTLELEGVLHGGYGQDFNTEVVNGSYCQKTNIKDTKNEMFYEYISKVSNVQTLKK